MEPFEPKLILAPTDFSEPAAHALRYASALAERFGAHLLVVHAGTFSPVVDFTAIPPAVFEDVRDSMIENAREVLQRHAEENIDSTVPFDMRVIMGGALDAINAQVQESGANLVVMGTHGRTGVGRLFLGSVTEAVMQTSTVPVIAVHSGAQEKARIHKILCPVTFTAASREALRCAAALSNSETAPLVLLHPVHGGETAMHALSHMRKWIPPELAGRCEMKLTTAKDADAIVAMAQDAGTDLIALGIKPSVSVYEALRGTLAEQIVQQSVCAVLTVNERAAVGIESRTADHHAGSFR